MTGYEYSRWHEECFGRCGDCASCLRLNNINEETNNVLPKRFLTVGSVRYGVRLGAVSPPPPGAGPRYRSQCCWPSNSSPGLVSQIPLLATPAINNRDIFSCVNRMRMAEDATSALPEQVKVRNQVLHCTKSLLKNQLSRRTLVKPQVYARLCECGDGNGADIFNTLDRLPRFRFGGNRNSSTGKERDRDKRTSEVRLRELTDRLKRKPIPPLRTRHVPHKVVHSPPPSPSIDTEDNCTRNVPLRSASFSQVDYSTDGKKYVRRRCPLADSHLEEDSRGRGAITLPRSKNSAHRPVVVSNQTPRTTPRQQDAQDVSELCEMIYEGCREENIVDSLNITPVETAVPVTDSKQLVVSDIIVRNSEVDNNRTEKKRDKSRRRKGIYISQWPNSYRDSEDILPQLGQDREFTEENFSTGLPRLKVCCETGNESSNSEDKPQSPEDGSETEWLTNQLNRVRPPLSTEVSEEKDPSIKINLPRSDSLSEGETDHSRCDQQGIIASDVSDCEVRTTKNEPILNHHIPRRYSKRPLRGPYGQMLEAEMKKPETGRKHYYTNELKFLEDITGPSAVSLSCSSSVGSGDPKPKYISRIRGSSNHSLDDSQLKNCLSSVGVNEKQLQPLTKRKISIDSVVPHGNRNESEPSLVISHQRTTSSPSKLEGTTTSVEPSAKLLEHLLKGSSEQVATTENLQRSNDTRTHVVVELYDTERSYVESLQILVSKYLEPLKSTENAGLLDVNLVDEIFFQIPSLLSHHEVFLEELKKRLDHWDIKQKVGDVFLETFSKPAVIESYTNYVNNWKRARDIIKNAQQSKPAFAKFLENTAREHKGKLALDSLLIKPIQKFPKYELLLQRLIKHTDVTHPDHSLLLSAQREVHDQLLRINCTEREALELEQLREIEALIDGLIELVVTDRQYLRHDLVSIAAGGGTRKERALFLFSDLLLVTSMKRKSGTIRKASPGQGSVTSSLDANKYKLLMKISLDDLDIVKAKDEGLKQMMVEIENLTEDVSVLNQINELTWTLHCTHNALDEVIKDMFEKLNKQLVEQQNSDSQLSCLDLTLSTSNGLETMSIVFSKPEKRASWEESFNEAKHKLATTGDRRPSPELIAAVPIRKTRAGLQFTCAAPTIGENRRDVWVCNSDGYVGQVCVLSLQPEPNVTSCNGVCNARILCIASIPGINSGIPSNRQNNGTDVIEEHSTIQFDSSSSSEDEDRSDGEESGDISKSSAPTKLLETSNSESDETDNQQSTMWLGTEDGCIHVYNSSDNIRIKKNKIKLQHGSAVLSIIYMDNKVYIALGNGDIIIYDRESSGCWNTSSPTTVSVGSTAMPVSKMIPGVGKLWCGCGNTVKVFNTETMVTENSVAVNNDANKPITCIMLSGNGLWLSLQTSAIIKCFHTISFELLCEVNIAPAVTKMLTSCDDIIRQHKAACLRVTSLLACKDLLWIGTSAGVLLTMPLPHITPTTTKMNSTPSVVGVSYGHTGHVRFLTNVEYPTTNAENTHQRYSYKGKPDQRANAKLLVISGGDGYEDFRSSNISEVAGREDSTNHLLLWNI